MCPSFDKPAELVLNKVHIVHWSVSRKLADMEFDIVVDMEVDKVADMVADKKSTK